MKFITNFENICIDLAIENKYDFVICGHIHEPKIEVRETSKGTTTYLNSGDWIENLTALEYNFGKWKIFKYNSDDFKTIDDEPLFEYENQLAEQFINIIK